MKLPFISEIPDFKPRKHIGQDTSLPKFEQDVLEALDVIEQRGDYALTLAMRAYNGMLVLIAVIGLILIVNLPIGAMATKTIKAWFTPIP